MKKLLFVYLIFSFHFAIGQNLCVTLYNTTGYDLDSVSFTGTYVGKIAKSDSTTLKGLKELTMIGDGTLEWATGTIKGKKIELPTLGCGTGSFVVNSGNYKFNLVLNEYTLHRNVYDILVEPHELVIRIFNKTPYNLDSTFVGNIYAGKIKKDSSIAVYTTKDLEVGFIINVGTVPINPPSAIIAGKRRKGRKRRYEEFDTVTTGYYWFDIYVPDKGNKYSLLWRSHDY